MKNKFDEIENIIVGGDFNCPLNPIIDKRGGNLIPRQSVINAIGQSKLDLHDIWRIKNPTRHNFTWRQSQPLIFLGWTIGLSQILYRTTFADLCNVDMVIKSKRI